MRWVLCTIALAGCNSILGIHDFQATDSGVATGDGGSGQTCLGSADSLFRMCVDNDAPAIPVFPNTIDTDTCPGTVVLNGVGSGAIPVCAIATSQPIELPSITVTGARPLAIVSLQSITVAGTIDLSAHGGVSAGTGLSDASCGDTAGANTPNGGTGGAGGSFGTSGGGGGGNGTTSGPMPAPSPPGRQLRRGCPGGNGGPANGTATSPAGGGAAGGGIYLLARAQVTISGSIFASGGGGQGGNGGSTAGGGGGGGGTGGLIGLDAPTIVVGGNLVANGGAGGGAGGDGVNATGKAGQDGTTGNGQLIAMGGTGSGGGGTGGNGTTGSDDGTGGGDQNGPDCGAGGGGGGAGIVFAVGLVMRQSAMIISPPITPP